MKKINFFARIFPFFKKHRIANPEEKKEISLWDTIKLQLADLEEKMKAVLLEKTWLEAVVKFYQIAHLFNESGFLKKMTDLLNNNSKNDPNLAYLLMAFERLNNDLCLTGRPGTKSIIFPKEGDINNDNLLVGGYTFEPRSVSYWLDNRSILETEPLNRCLFRKDHTDEKISGDCLFLNCPTDGDPITEWRLINDLIAGNLVRKLAGDVRYRISLIIKFCNEIEQTD